MVFTNELQAWLVLRVQYQEVIHKPIGMASMSSRMHRKRVLLGIFNAFAVLMSLSTPPIITEPDTQWGIKTGFLRSWKYPLGAKVFANKFNFAGIGTVAVAIAWFILPEVAHRTPTEIDEL